MLHAAGDVVGLSQLIEGITGERLGTGERMGSERRSESLGTGLGSATTAILGTRAFRFGVARGRAALTPGAGSGAGATGIAAAERAAGPALRAIRSGRRPDAGLLAEIAERVKQGIHAQAGREGCSLGGFCPEAGRLLPALEEALGGPAEGVAARLVRVVGAEGEGGGVHMFVVGRTRGGQYFIFDPTVEQFTTMPQIIGDTATINVDFLLASEEAGNFVNALHGRSGLATFSTEQAFQQALSMYLTLEEGPLRLEVIPRGSALERAAAGLAPLLVPSETPGRRPAVRPGDARRRSRERQRAEYERVAVELVEMYAWLIRTSGREGVNPSVVGTVREMQRLADDLGDINDPEHRRRLAAVIEGVPGINAVQLDQIMSLLMMRGS